MRAPRLTVRTRLTLLYGGLFLLSGSLLIVLLYLAVDNLYPSGTATAGVLSRRLEAATPDRREEIVEALDGLRSNTLQELLERSAIALVLVTVLATVAGWIMAGRALRPVQRITETTQRVADRSLHERIGLNGPRDEFKDLADTIDAMLERLDGAFESQRRFVANASHELRTPITINRTLLEVATAHSTISPDLRRIIDMVLESNDRSGRLLDGLLTLARSENEALDRQPVDLSDIAAHAIEESAAEASTAGIRLDAITGPAPTAGDAALLERLALNLVHNGIRHNHTNGWVKVVTDRPGFADHVELIVTNSGAAIPAYDIDSLFQPFRRGNGDRMSSAQGIGLGLSIVQSIARTHGGEVAAMPRDGGGLVVRVRLPAIGYPPGHAT